MRYLHVSVLQDLEKKAVLLAGPRQAGKSTFAKELMTKNSLYLNWDIANDRRMMRSASWDKKCDIVVLDEFHKMPAWKNRLKGLVDSDRNRPRLLVTGSARLDILRRGGDALTGRQFHYRLHPLDVSEASSLLPGHTAQKQLERLLITGGFPEAFLNPKDAERLRNDRFDIVVREDLRDFAKVQSLSAVQTLVDILRERGPGQLSYKSIAEDLGVSAPTVKAWIDLLQRLYLIFLVAPFTGRLERSLRKEPKFYFFDCAAAYDTNSGARFENLVACSLLKYCHFMQDTQGKRFDLHYFRDKEKREVDFVVTLNRKPYWLIECKLSDDTPSPHLRYLGSRLKGTECIQLVMNLSRTSQHHGVRIVPAHSWLANLWARV